jgi:hypothetical protein
MYDFHFRKQVSSDNSFRKYDKPSKPKEEESKEEDESVESPKGFEKYCKDPSKWVCRL